MSSDQTPHEVTPHDVTPHDVTPHGVTPHEVVNPPGLLPPVGFAHAVVAAAGRTVSLGGMTGHARDGGIAGSLVEQFDAALANLVTALTACRARPEHLVSLQVYVTDVGRYRAELRALGEIYRGHLGRHFPAMALFGVAELFDPRAVVELVGTAVVPEEPSP